MRTFTVEKMLFPAGRLLQRSLEMPSVMQRQFTTVAVFALLIASCNHTVPDANPILTTSAAALAPHVVSTPKYAEYFVIPEANANPESMIVGPDSNFWFSEGPSIEKMTLKGAFKTYTTGLLEAWGLAIGSDRDIWFICSGGSVYLGVCKMTTSGQSSILKGTFYFTGPFVRGSDGNLWSPAYDEVSKIGRITPAGSAKYYAEPANGRIENIAPGTTGFLWFTDDIDNKVGSITTTGKIREYNVPLVNSLPGGLALGADGNIWLTPTAYQDLVRVAPSGRGKVYKVGIQSAFVVRGNSSFVYAIATTGQVIQMDTSNGKSTISWPPSGWWDTWTVTSVVRGPDHNLWLSAEGHPTSIVQRILIPGGKEF